MKDNTIKAGMMKLGLIKLILIIAMRVEIGPSTPSVRAKNRLLSIVPRSFESLLTNIPEGVSSKKLEGLRTIEWIIFL